jgi:hypothetical protein
MITAPIFPNFAYAHITGDRTQQWINPQDNVRIQFTYEPEKPPNGDFSVNSTFLNEGTYQVILRINSKDYAIALASFRVFVPFQPLGTINLNYTIPLLLPAALAGIIGVIVIATFLIIVKRKYKKRRSSEE